MLIWGLYKLGNDEEERAQRAEKLAIERHDREGVLHLKKGALFEEQVTQLKKDEGYLKAIGEQLKALQENNSRLLLFMEKEVLFRELITEFALTVALNPHSWNKKVSFYFRKMSELI